MNIHRHAYHALMRCDPAEKVAEVNALSNRLNQSGLALTPGEIAVRLPIPGRPDKPELVSPAQVPRRKIGSQAGRLIQFHAFAHIEFNAINLALDAVYRFSGMPDEYYFDWIKVAVEEARHFALLREYLNAHNVDYGDFVAHNNLWDMAVATDHDVMVRMALVPRVLEARGLDVTPKIIQKLKNLNDQRAVDILEIIYRDEIGHVAIGNRWFNYLCNQRSLDSRVVFEQLLKEYTRGYLSGPFNREARLAAGFTHEDMDAIVALEKTFLTAKK